MNLSGNSVKFRISAISSCFDNFSFRDWSPIISHIVKLGLRDFLAGLGTPLAKLDFRFFFIRARQDIQIPPVVNGITEVQDFR